MAAELADVERELRRIADVVAVRLVAGDDEELTEVHVLAAPGKHPKQVVRDIQSVAMASFGFEIDHRIVSVVQLEGEHFGAGPAGRGPGGAQVKDPATATEHGDASAARRANGHRVVIEAVGTSRERSSYAARVVLRRGDEEAEGRAETAGGGHQLRLVAEAALDALRRLEPGASRLLLETATVVQLGGRSLAAVSLVLPGGQVDEVLAGSAPMRGTVDQESMVRAVLDATNRRLPQLSGT